MAVRFIEGFDCYGTAAQITGLNFSGVHSLPAGRGGVGKCLRSNSISLEWNIPIPVDTNEIYTAFGYYWDGTQCATITSAWGIFAFRYATSVALSLRTLSSGAIEFRRGHSSAAIIATTNIPLTVNDWNHISFEVRLINNATGWLRVYINGVLAAEAIDVQTSAFAVLPDNISARPNVAGDFKWDDIYIVDASPGGPTGLLGDRRCASYYPIADGAESDFVPSSGTDNFAMVNEEVPDEDTTYISSATPGDRDLYKFSSPAPGKSIDAMRIMVRARKEDPGGNNLKIVTKSGAAVVVSDFKGAALSYNHVSEYVQVNPATGLPWTPEEFAAAEFGQEIAV
jgi:hypothetical protein